MRRLVTRASDGRFWPSVRRVDPKATEPTVPGPSYRRNPGAVEVAEVSRLGGGSTAPSSAVVALCDGADLVADSGGVGGAQCALEGASTAAGFSVATNSIDHGHEVLSCGF